jgi:hypothetical protein
MKIFLNIAWLIALCSCVDIADAQVSQAQKSPESPFTLTLSSPQSTIHAGSEVKIDITLTNVSQQDIYYFPVITGRPSDMEGGFRLDVRDSENKRVQETAHGMKVHDSEPTRTPHRGSVFSTRQTIKPGGTLLRSRVLSEEFNLSKPGQYTVQAERADPLTHLTAKSNKLVITVLP